MILFEFKSLILSKIKNVFCQKSRCVFRSVGLTVDP